MGEVLIDEWTLRTVYDLLTGPAEIEDRYISKSCMAYFTTAIVLWDKLSYITAGDTPDPVTDDLWISLKELLSSKDNIIESGSMSSMLDLLFADLPNPTPYGWHPPDYALQRSKLYLEISKKWGINYLPHPFRAKYMKDNKLIGFDFDRIKLLENLDNSLKKYYAEINKIYGSGICYAKYPLLYDYIRRNCDNPADELNATLELRKNKDVIKFRKSLNNLDDMFNAGNLKGVYLVLKEMEELSETITKACTGAKIPEMSIGLSGPSIKLPSIDFPRKKIIHMTFLTRLADFGIEERLDRNYRKFIDLIKEFD
jgi:hypothetical protein